MRDHNRAALVALEHQLLADDPLWALSFHAGQRRLGVPAQERLSDEDRRVLRQVLYGTAAFFTATLSLVLLTVSVTAGLFLAAVTGVLLWMMLRARDAKKQRMAAGPDSLP